MIQPLLGQGTLYHINRNRDRWLMEMERRKAFYYVCAITVSVAVIVMSWIVKPVPSFDKGEPVVRTQQGDR